MSNQNEKGFHLFDDEEIEQVMGNWDDSDVNHDQLLMCLLREEQELLTGNFVVPSCATTMSQTTSACTQLLSYPGRSISQESIPDPVIEPLPFHTAKPQVGAELGNDSEDHLSAPPPSSDTNQEGDNHTFIMEKPKRSLTAYNLFFKDERERLLRILPAPDNKKKRSRRAHGKIGFAEMARTVAANWKTITLERKMEYEYQSELDKERFEREYAIWKKLQKQQKGNGSSPKRSTQTPQATALWTAAPVVTEPQNVPPVPV